MSVYSICGVCLWDRDLNCVHISPIFRVISFAFPSERDSAAVVAAAAAILHLKANRYHFGFHLRTCNYQPSCAQVNKFSFLFHFSQSVYGRDSSMYDNRSCDLEQIRRNNLKQQQQKQLIASATMKTVKGVEARTLPPFTNYIIDDFCFFFLFLARSLSLSL